jgi:hypothetical protein
MGERTAKEYEAKVAHRVTARNIIAIFGTLGPCVRTKNGVYRRMREEDKRESV